MPTSPDKDEAFRRFLRRVWRDDVAPLLRDRRAADRRQAARAGGKIAATGGLLVDTLFGLKGKPFARFMTVMGTRLGAILPDAWDWQWLRESATPEQRQRVAREVRRRAGQLPERAALGLFGLSPSATRDDAKRAWREVSLRWHPDHAPDDARRREYHVRFVAYRAAYERLLAAYDDGRLPVKGFDADD